MKTLNFSLIRILFALVIGLVLVIWPDAAASYIVMTVGVAFLIPCYQFVWLFCSQTNQDL